MVFAGVEFGVFTMNSVSWIRTFIVANRRQISMEIDSTQKEEKTMLKAAPRSYWAVSVSLQLFVWRKMGLERGHLDATKGRQGGGEGASTPWTDETYITKSTARTIIEPLAEIRSGSQVAVNLRRGCSPTPANRISNLCRAHSSPLPGNYYAVIAVYPRLTSICSLLSHSNN